MRLKVQEYNMKTTEQTTTSKTDTTQVITTVSASDELSAEDKAAKEWIAQKESSGSYHSTRWPILWSLQTDYHLFE